MPEEQDALTAALGNWHRSREEPSPAPNPSCSLTRAVSTGLVSSPLGKESAHRGPFTLAAPKRPSYGGYQPIYNVLHVRLTLWRSAASTALSYLSGARRLQRPVSWRLCQCCERLRTRQRFWPEHQRHLVMGERRVRATESWRHRTGRMLFKWKGIELRTRKDGLSRIVFSNTELM